MANKRRLDAYPPSYWNILTILTKKNEYVSPPINFNQAVSLRQRWYSFRKALTDEASRVAEYANMNDSSAATELKAKIQNARRQREDWIKAQYPWPLAPFVARLGAQMLDLETGMTVNTNVVFRPEQVKLRFFDTCEDVGIFEEDAALQVASVMWSEEYASARPATQSAPVIATPFGKKSLEDYEDTSADVLAGIYQLDKPSQAREIPAEQLAEHEARMAELRRKAAEKDLPSDLPTDKKKPDAQ